MCIFATAKYQQKQLTDNISTFIISPYQGAKKVLQRDDINGQTRAVLSLIKMILLNQIFKPVLKISFNNFQKHTSEDTPPPNFGKALYKR